MKSWNGLPMLVGVLIWGGGVLGLIDGLAAMIANRYLQVGLSRMALITLSSGVVRGILWGLAAAGAGIVMAFLAGEMRTPPRPAARAWGAGAGLIGLGLLAADIALRRLTIYSLPLAWEKAGRIGEGILGGKGGEQLISLPRRHPEIIALLGAGLVVGLLIVVAARKAARWRLGKVSGIVGGGGIALLAVLLLAPSLLPATEGPNILLIVADCLRADRVGESREQPGISALAGDSLFFVNGGRANAPWTKPAMASLLSSLPPTAHGAVDPLSALPAGVTTLAEILRNRGYRTFFLNGGNPHLTEEFGFGQGFAELEVTPRRYGPDLVRAWERQLERGGEPFFGLIHFMDLHLPYNANPLNPEPGPLVPKDIAPGKIGYERVISATAGAGSGELRTYLEALYDSQVIFLDKMIGRIVTDLRREGLLESTIVILTGDHGEEFWEHEGFGHGHNLYEELLRIPLLVRIPGKGGSRIKTVPRQIDIAPLILSLAGLIDSGPTFAGRDPLQEPAGITECFAGATSFGDEKFCLVRWPWKLIQNTGETGGKTPALLPLASTGYELYQLEEDPGELHDRSVENPEMVRELAAALERRSREKPVADAQRSAAGAAAREKLKALGYLN